MRTLVAVDLSPGSEEALRQATSVAAIDNEPLALAVCHVIPNLQTMRPLFPQHLMADADFLLNLPERAAAAVRSSVERIAKLNSEEYQLFIEQGIDYAEIVRRADSWKADRIVVGTHGTGGLLQLLGGVAERVVRHASCSVLCARSPDAARASGPVIAATDLSDPSVPAIEQAAVEARRRNVPLVVAHVQDFGDAALANIALSPLVASSWVPSSTIKAAGDLARAVITQHLERLGATGEIAILDGGAASSIARLAEDRKASLVVVGTRGKTGLMQLALGSVAERIVRGAPCSVLAVRLKGTV